MPSFAVVDDNSTNRRILAQLARSVRPDTEVRDFGCPVEALDWLTTSTVDLMVTDFRMPGMNGDELIRQFRKLPGRDAVPVIAVTAFEDKELRYRALDAGATDFLLNPIDHREFRSRASNLLELYRLKQIVDRKAVSLEHQLRRVIDTVPAMISASDGDGRLLFVNRYLADFLDLDLSQTVGQGLTDVFGQEAGMRHLQADRAILRGSQSSARFDEVQADAASRKHDLLTIKAPLKEENGCIETVVTVSLDITEQKQQAAELAEQSVLMEAALSSMEQGICMTNSNLDIVAVNRRLEELVPNADQRYRLGMNLRDVIRANAAKGVYGPGDAEQLARNQIEALESRRNLKFERLESNDRYLETTGRPLPGGGYVATYTDITDRKAAEEALRESEGRFRDFAGASSDWVWETDAEHRFTIVSERLCEITGVGIEYFIGRTPWETAGKAAEADAQWAEHRSMMDGKEPFRDIRCTTVDAHGRMQHWKVSGKPVVDDAGTFRGYRGTGTCETEAVEARERAKQAESRLTDALEVIPEGFAIYDADDRLVLFNSKYEELYDATGDALVAGARFEDILRAGVKHGQYTFEPGREEQWIEQRLAEFRKKKDPVEQEHASGRWLLIDDRRTSEGGTVCVRTDITQLKERERELSEKSTLLEVTLNSMPQGLVAFEDDLTIVASNASAADILAVGPNLLQRGEDFEKVVRVIAERGDYGAGEPADHVARHLEAIRAGNSQFFELALPDGRMLIMRGRPVVGGGCVTTVIDVTERMQAEAALRRQQSMFEAIFRGAPDALVMADSAHAIIMANPAAADLFGYEPEDMVGVAAASLYENNREYVREGHKAFYAEDGEERDAHVAQFRRRNGEVFAGELVGTVILGEDGDIFGYLSLIRDVTMRQEAEDRHRQGQKLEALGQMAGGIAHEFNNLLTSISGFTKMALKKPDDVDRVKDCLGEVVDASSRAADLTRQMLTFSHKQVLEPKVVRVGSVLSDSDKLIRAFIEESIDLTIDIVDPDACIEVDPARLSQALVNLVNNARHAMPEGGKLVLRAEAVDLAAGFVSSHGDSLPPGRYARIDVMDSGTGIEPDVRAKIFDPYFTTKDKGKGTGLGLSLVYGMVKNSQGVISVDSFMGAGTKFSIYLPIVDKAPCYEPKEAESQQEILGGAETILVAEDDNQLRTFVRTILEDAGFQVLTATDGANALQIHDENADVIDMLVTDVIMPKMGGVDLVKALTAKRPDLKVVYMSGYAPELTEQIKEIGDEFCFLRKPFEPDALSRMVREALNS